MLFSLCQARSNVFTLIYKRSTFATIIFSGNKSLQLEDQEKNIGKARGLRQTAGLYGLSKLEPCTRLNKIEVYLVFFDVSFLALMPACWEEAILDHSTNLDKKFGRVGMREMWYNPIPSACQEAHLVPLPCDVHIDGSSGHACVTQCLLADNNYQVEFQKHFYQIKFPSFEVMR